MIVNYYKNENLAYATRKRYNTINIEPDFTENQFTINLGDGASTSIKTNSSHICNYVTIQDTSGYTTRWYVVSYNYLNGGQVVLNLQRDVVGEFGISNCYGKIERGIPTSNNSIFSKRKELKLNQILKERNYVIPNTNTYGNYTVYDYGSNTTTFSHNKEMWGVLYFIKPSQDSPYQINVPQFSPNVLNYPSLENNTTRYKVYSQNMYFNFYLVIKPFGSPIGYFYRFEISFLLDETGRFRRYVNTIYVHEGREFISSDYTVIEINQNSEVTDVKKIAEKIGISFADFIIDNQNNTDTDVENSFKFPSLSNITLDTPSYDGVIIKIDNQTIKYNGANAGTEKIYGTYQNLHLYNLFIDLLNNGGIVDDGIVYSWTVGSTNNSFYGKNEITLNKINYTSYTLTDEEAGNITISSSTNLVDEPYSILVCPLFDCRIVGGNNTYDVTKEKSFAVFNSIIETLSGDNSVLVDAQIYPYCPYLFSVASHLNDVPLFTIPSTTFEHNCQIQLNPNSDIKKEYIEREYSILSPEQSNKFVFNFYDYVNTLNVSSDEPDINTANISLKVKTSLKPFGIISSCVIIPELNSIKGITYDSDLRGSQPTSNGFECSLSSNAFETYRRQNSTYQQMFNLEQEELRTAHQVEAVNEATSAVVNIASATAMGTLAGAEIAGAWGKIVPVGGAVGGVAAGGVVGVAEGVQMAQNTKLREYEENLQQQKFDLNIQTIKNIPNTLTRISTFNEILMRDFWYVIETYECSDEEKEIVNDFLEKYSYGIGVFGFYQNFYQNGRFIKGMLITSNLITSLHNVMSNELKGGVYIYE